MDKYNAWEERVAKINILIPNRARVLFMHFLRGMPENNGIMSDWNE